MASSFATPCFLSPSGGVIEEHIKCRDSYARTSSVGVRAPSQHCSAQAASSTKSSVKGALAFKGEKKENDCLRSWEQKPSLFFQFFALLQIIRMKRRE